MTDILELLDLHADSCEALSGEDMPEGTYETRAWQLQSAIAMAKAARQMRAAIESIANLRRELGLAREDLARFRAERSYVIGCNTGWEEAIEQAVKAIEAYAQRLVPDPANDRARYHVRYAADDVRALAELDGTESEGR